MNYFSKIMTAITFYLGKLITYCTIDIYNINTRMFFFLMKLLTNTIDSNDQYLDLN